MVFQRKRFTQPSSVTNERMSHLTMFFQFPLCAVWICVGEANDSTHPPQREPLGDLPDLSRWGRVQDEGPKDLTTLLRPISLPINQVSTTLVMDIQKLLDSKNWMIISDPCRWRGIGWRAQRADRYTFQLGKNEGWDEFSWSWAILILQQWDLWFF